MSVSSPLKNKLSKAENKSKHQSDAGSSRAAARARLERLGVGKPIVKVFSKQRTVDSGSVITDAPVRQELRAFHGIKRKKRWERAAPVTFNAAESFMYVDAEPDLPESSLKTDIDIKQFHCYAVSLVSVLACGFWVFGYFMLR